MHRLAAPPGGRFVAPALIKVSGIADLEKEVFGPVLHLATFAADELDQVITAINDTGYGLTFGLHSRIDDRVQHVADRVEAGNIYANRNQIGAIVGSQPFGGEGLSGTGPKAGGPHYLARFTRRSPDPARGTEAPTLSIPLPCPTGELNRLSLHPRPTMICAGPGDAVANQQRHVVEAMGGVAEAHPNLTAETVAALGDIGGVLWWGDDEEAGRALSIALTQRDGPIIPLITDHPDIAHIFHERHLCVDTTAAGGNAALLAGSESGYAA